jgi:hypothetical protein
LNNPASLNYYTYVYNNPLRYVDPSGNIPVETIFDIGSLIYSTFKYIKNPTAENYTYVAWDLAASATPYLPGSYVKRGLDKGIDVAQSIKSVPVPNKGFDSFGKLKGFLGDPGKGNAWHHFVEQSQVGKRANFTSKRVNNLNNIIAIPHGKGTVHSEISAHYSSKFKFTDGLTVRDWLATKSFDFQFQYGKELLEQYGTVTATDKGWIFKPFK